MEIHNLKLKYVFNNLIYDLNSYHDIIGIVNVLMDPYLNIIKCVYFNNFTNYEIKTLFML